MPPTHIDLQGINMGTFKGTLRGGRGGKYDPFLGPRDYEKWNWRPQNPPKYSPQNSGKQIFEKITLKPSQLASK